MAQQCKSNREFEHYVKGCNSASATEQPHGLLSVLTDTEGTQLLILLF